MASSLTSLSHAALINNLKHDLEVQTRNSRFACGGTISIAQEHEEGSQPAKSKNKADDQDAAANKPLDSSTRLTPVTIRFGPPDGGRTLHLPIANDQDRASFDHLVKTSQPATFGRGGQDIHDETYRKATKVDTTDFCTDFCPYASGIIDVAIQVLLPGVRSSRGIRAELYKLNVYSGPSGKFMPHVDTPRSTEQIGSLVVALPVAFTGGQLAVRNAGHEVVFEWAASEVAESSVQWAAFYSDCEHEVYTVRSGHRLTLTYNLFVSRGAGLLAGRSTKLDSSSLPLYHSLVGALNAPGFMPQGGLLGFHLYHSYPHSHRKLYRELPASLRGVDMVLYECAGALGLTIKLAPVSEGGRWDRNASYIMRRKRKEVVVRSDDEMDEEEAAVTDKTMTREPLQTSSSSKPVLTNSLHAMYISDELDQSDYHGEFAYWFDKYAESEITWVTKEKHRELQMAYMAYGNQAELEFKYTSVALIVDIPSFSRRHIPGC